MNIKSLTTRTLFILLFLFSFSVYAVDIKVQVDRAQIELNETFTLIFETSESPDDDPDFSPLEKDFQVLGTSTSSNMSIINGNYTRSKKWNVNLIALHKGTITIPSISFGSDKSPTAQITISAPQKSTGKQGEAFISELEIDSSTAYPQQQIIVTQRLLSNSSINAYEFSPLKTSGVEVTKETLGDIKQFQTRRGDTPYLVLEQSYAIYPQSAGQLTIEPSVASARITIQGNRGNRNAFDPFRNNTKTLRRSSAKKTLTIKAIPAAFKGKHWLAAKEVQLVEEFPESNNFKVGEPITRTLVLMADGQNASQLPEFFTRDVKGLKQYPDKPLLKNTPNDTGITGVQQLKVAIIPSSAGTYTLPAISIPWWNTQTHKLAYAKIPSRTFSVTGAAKSTANIIAPPKLNNEEEITDNNGPAEIIDATTNDISNNTSDDSSLLWKIISSLLAVSLIIALFLLWKKPKAHIATEVKPHINSPSVKKALKNIKQACENNDAQLAKNSLLDWDNALFINQPAHSLGELANRLDSNLAEKIQLLNSILYRDQTERWQCDQLYTLCIEFTEIFNAEAQQNKKKDNAGNLESLYK